MYAIHLPRSSLFCEQAVYRQGEGSLVLWRKRTSSHEDGAGKREGMSLQLWPSGWRERASCPLPFVPVSWIVSSLTRPRQSPLLGACGKALLSGAGRQANALTGRTREHPQGHALRLANFTPRWAKPTASPGPLLPSFPCKKIGRAASVGLGYREKKRYRSPLVSL